ncbi:MAG TPA: S46 family peptidase, partial [Gemmatimonadales bacterium]|nr:S46 family peptidase [Gemmatimonadales bacterium]
MKADPSIIDATILSLQPISLMRTLTRLALLLLVLLPARLLGQATPEGEYPGLETGKMWTFDNPPKEYWAKRYQFTPSGDWMNHVQLSALRYGNGCTASFVSGNGLVMSNHHCARACIEGSAKTGEDFLSNGFYAAKREDERACPGLFLDQLQEITDVTDRVSAAATAKMDPKTAGAERAKVTHAIEEECRGT